MECVNKKYLQEEIINNIAKEYIAAQLFNRAVIFETNNYSYHGYGKISLPKGETRKFFYTYFYTEEQGNQKKIL